MKKKTATAGRKPGNPALLLRLPENVNKLVNKDAKSGSKTSQAVILAILATHYGIEVAEPKRGGKKAEE